MHYWGQKRIFKPFYLGYSLCKCLIFTQCSWQRNCSPQGGGLTVSLICILTLQMETLYYKLFHYRNVTLLSFQMNSNAPTWCKQKKGKEVPLIWIRSELFEHTLQSLFKKPFQLIYAKDFPLCLVLLIRFSCLCFIWR